MKGIKLQEVEEKGIRYMYEDYKGNNNKKSEGRIGKEI